MNTSGKGLAFIRSKEKLSLKVYDDGNGVPTQGWGHTGVEVRFGGPDITIEQAEAWFRADVAKAESEVRRLVTGSINQCMFDALVSFEFNCGGLVFITNGHPQRSRVLRALDDRRYCDTVEELIIWNNDGGRGVRGLLVRRLEEGLMFASDPFPD